MREADLSLYTLPSGAARDIRAARGTRWLIRRVRRQRRPFGEVVSSYLVEGKHYALAVDTVRSLVDVRCIATDTIGD
jgi:hypothetical protein